METLIVLVFFIAIGGVAFYVAAMEKKRREALAKQSQRLGFGFVAEKDLELLSEVKDLEIFQRGRNRRVTNVMDNSASDSTTVVFDYRFTEGGRKSSHTFQQTIVWTKNRKRLLPRFVLRPESFWDKFANLLGFADIDFPKHQSFSKAYLLQGDDGQALRQLFSDDTLSFFEKERDWGIEAINDSLIIYRPKTRVNPENLPAFLSKAEQIDRILTPR